MNMRKKIKTKKDAITFIKQLIEAGLMFHLDDNPDDIIWDDATPNIALLTKRHQELWEVGNPWEYAEDTIDRHLESLV